MRPDSIRKKGLKNHINRYAEDHGIPYGYKDFTEWVERGVLGQPVSKSWIRRQFGGLAEQTLEKWLTIYEEEKR